MIQPMGRTQADLFDPLIQDSLERVPGATSTPSPSLDFEGLSDDDNAATIGIRVVPPDTEGDVGQDYYVQWVGQENYDLAVGLYSCDPQDSDSTKDA